MHATARNCKRLLCALHAVNAMRVHCDRTSCLAGKDAAGFSQPYFCLHGVTGRGWFFTALFLSAWAGFSQPYFCPAWLEKDAAGFLTARFLSALLEKDATGFSQPCLCPALLEKDAAGFSQPCLCPALLEKDAAGFSQSC